MRLLLWLFAFLGALGGAVMILMLLGSPLPGSQKMSGIMLALCLAAIPFFAARAWEGIREAALGPPHERGQPHFVDEAGVGGKSDEG